MAVDNVPVALQPLFNSITSLFTNSRWSDLEVRCGDRKWAVHKAIICSQSEYFAKACDGRFKEATEGIISLEEDLPDAVHALLHFLYTGDYDDTACQQGENMEPLVFNVHIQSLADKYGHPKLTELASTKYKARAEIKWNTAAFADSIAEIYQIPEADNKKELRECAVRIAARHATELKGNEYGARFREVARTVPHFAAEVLDSVLDARDDAIPVESPVKASRKKASKGYTICSAHGAFHYNCDQ